MDVRPIVRRRTAYGAAMQGNASVRPRVVALFVLLAVVAVGCGFHTITPPGAEPLRYRDQILTETTNFLYWMLDLQHAAP